MGTIQDATNSRISHADLLRAARGRRTQRELAVALGVSASMISRIERGHRRLTVGMARALDTYLNTETTFEYLARLP